MPTLRLSLTVLTLAFTLSATLGACGGAGRSSGPTTQPVAVAAPGSYDLDGRTITFNGRSVEQDASDLNSLRTLEQNRGSILPTANYWYDPRSGALGYWGGPIVEFVTAGLAFAPLPPDASGGGTNVFLNGREVHPEDLSRISQLVGRSVPEGRYWMDANGDAGPEGGGTLLNIFAEVERQGGAVPGR